MDKNPYNGINAHFHSWLVQSFGGWQTFHHDHITDLKNAINHALPTGYFAVSEQSLQIHEVQEPSPKACKSLRFPPTGFYR